MSNNSDLVKRIIFAVLGVGLIAYGFTLQSVEPTARTGPQVRNATGAGNSSSGPALVKVPIKDLRVGTRVPAFNPEVSAGERRGFSEPNWYRWMKLRLEMPKPDGTMLEIEMLRSEDWLLQQVMLVVERIPVMLSGKDDVLVSAELQSGSSFPIENTTNTEFDQATVGQISSGFSTTGVPLRPIYRHLTELLIEATASRNQVLGLVVELDLPELGLNGPAWIVDLEPAPFVPAGPGQVVTATFKHASASVLDLVLASTPPATPSSQTAFSSSPSSPDASPTDTIGVTANHPFWSVDRAKFVQAGELRIGERLQTLAGDIQWVQQKLPRPGPEPVYNLEVHDEHVYYVGNNRVLAHNSYASKRAPRLTFDGPPSEIRRHHIFNKFRGKSPKSQKYRDFFRRHGIDVDQYAVDIPLALHKDWIHKAGQNWTTTWKRWIDANSNATTQEVYHQAGRMMERFGISHLPIIPY